MLQSSPRRWPPALVTFALWAALAAGVVHWALRLGGGPTPLAAPAGQLAGAPQAPAAPDPVTIGRWLGAPDLIAPAAQPAGVAGRFALKGVIAAGRAGTALIGVDGQPARPFGVGRAVADGLVLQAVGARSATLGASPQGPALVTLELPARR